jgi:hypothetical protein
VLLRATNCVSGLWLGHRLFVVDGSSFSMPDTPELHPANSPQPSGTDERTFERVFGRSDWAVMFILAHGGQCYARLRYNVGPGAEIELKVDVDYGRPFAETDFELWHQEYLANVQIEPVEVPNLTDVKTNTARDDRDEPFLEDWWRDALSDYSNVDNEHEETIFGYIRDFQ